MKREVADLKQKFELRKLRGRSERSVPGLVLGYIASYALSTTTTLSSPIAVTLEKEGITTRLRSLVERPEDTLSGIYQDAEPIDVWKPFPHGTADYAGKEWPAWGPLPDGNISEKDLQVAWNGIFDTFKALGPTWSLLDTHTGTCPRLCSPLETTLRL